MKKLVTITLFLLPIFSYAQQSGPDDRYKIKLSIAGEPIQGSQERIARLEGLSKVEQDQILNEDLPSLTRNSTYQIVVSVTDPDGKTINYTGSKRLKYVHFECLTISAKGLLTITPSSQLCSGEDYPEIWIFFKSPSGEEIALNEYLFRVK